MIGTGILPTTPLLAATPSERRGAHAALLPSFRRIRGIDVGRESGEIRKDRGRPDMLAARDAEAIHVDQNVGVTDFDVRSGNRVRSSFLTARAFARRAESKSVVPPWNQWAQNAWPNGKCRRPALMPARDTGMRKSSGSSPTCCSVSGYALPASRNATPRSRFRGRSVTPSRCFRGYAMCHRKRVLVYALTAGPGLAAAGTRTGVGPARRHLPGTDGSAFALSPWKPEVVRVSGDVSSEEARAREVRFDSAALTPRRRA
jgi:hypothetical protein